MVGNMTTDEWIELVDWVNDRFQPGWTVDRAAAYGFDLKEHSAEDVWDALYRLYDKGLEYPPNGSQLKKGTVEVIRARMERAKWDRQGLPAPQKTGQGWNVWRTQLGYAGLTFGEAVEAAHVRLFSGGCPYPGCGLCGNV